MRDVTPEEETVFRLIVEQYRDSASNEWGYFLYDFERAETRLREIVAQKEKNGESDPIEKYMDAMRQAETLRRLADKDILEIDYVEEMIEDGSISYGWHCAYEWSCSLTNGPYFAPEVYAQLVGRYYINTSGEQLGAACNELIEKYDATLYRTFDHLVVHCNNDDFLFPMPHFPTPSSIIDYATDKDHLGKPVTQSELITANILRDNNKPQIKNAFRKALHIPLSCGHLLQ